jgi:arabinogalactan oligomer / maltooligosaccharide transport system substrate-binding protein
MLLWQPNRTGPRRPPVLARLVGLALLLVTLSGCATGGAAVTPVPSAAPADAPVTLVVWHGWSGPARQALGRLADRYNQQHPTQRVSLVPVPLATFPAELAAAAAAGGGPHLALLPSTWIGELAGQGMLQPLDELLTPAERARLLPAALGAAQAPGADGTQLLYGLPVSFDTLALYYTTANLSAPPADTATLLSSARGLGDPGAEPPVWGLALNLSLDNTIGYLYAFGGRVFAEDGTLALGGEGAEGTARWLTWLQELNNDARILARADSSIQVDRELKDGRALMTFDWAHQLGTYRSLWGANLGVAPLPRLSETGELPRPYLRSDVLVLNARATSAEQQAALSFLRFMISDAAQLELLASDVQPASRAVSLEGDTARLAAARIFRAQAEQGLPMPNSPARGMVEQELKVMQRQVLLGLATPADAVSEADRRLRERAEQFANQ